VKVASIVGTPTQIAIFSFERGAQMAGLAAPARRVAFFLSNTTALNANGWTLFDAAVRWALATP
jgi:hypothetical protein